MTDPEALFVFYLTSVRLATIAAGIVAIRYGYRLFAAGVFKTDVEATKTEVAGRAGDYEFRFKTAAPGAVLGLFGAVIIVVTMVAAPPERTRLTRTMEQGPGGEVLKTVETEERMRGVHDSFAEQVDTARQYRQAKKIALAIGAYERAVRLAADPMHELAELYLDVDRLEAARDLVEVSHLISPSNPDYGNTLETVQGRLEQ